MLAKKMIKQAMLVLFVMPKLAIPISCARRPRKRASADDVEDKEDSDQAAESDGKRQ